MPLQLPPGEAVVNWGRVLYGTLLSVIVIALVACPVLLLLGLTDGYRTVGAFVMLLIVGGSLRLKEWES